MANDKTNNSQSRRVIDEFAGYASLHGLHFVIGRHQFAIRRIIWMLLLLVGFLLFGFTLRISIEKLTAYKSTMSRELNYSTKLKFPAFTFCNVNMMKKSKILGTDSQYFLDQLDSLTSTMQVKQEEQRMNDSFDIEKAVRENGHTAKDMIQGCVWNSQDCDYRNFSTFFSHKVRFCDIL
jgi:hypothetical protein